MIRVPQRAAIPILAVVTVLLLYIGYYGWSSPSSYRTSVSGEKYPLRILALGDSVTEGAYGNGNNGYRLSLRNRLLGYGHAVDFIGTLSVGEHNPDPEHEGHGGFHIKEIHAKILENNILAQHPNLILLHAGTNDLTWLFGWLPPQDPYEETPQRFNSLLDTILCECPDAVLLTAQIVDNKEYNASRRVEGFNVRVGEIAEERRAKGYKVQAVDHYAVSGKYLQPDFIHPTNEGYEMMSVSWFDAFKSLPADWIQPAREPSTEPAEKCKNRNAS